MSTEELFELKTDNFNRAMELVELKQKRLTYQEARIEALQREVERLQIENINLEIKLFHYENDRNL